MLPAGKFFRKIIAISPDLVYTGRCIGHPSLRRKQVSSPPVQPHPAASRRGRQNCLPRLFFAVFLFCRYSYFQRCHCSVFSLSRLLLSFRYLRFRHRCRTGFCTSPGFFDRPDIPPFPTLSSAWIPPFPGAAIISAPASFRCRSYAGIFSFSESIAVRFLEVFSLPVFRFWISERAAFIPFGFCAVVFSACIRRFCPVTAPFSDLGASRFLSSFCPALDAFLSSRRWCLPY